MYFFIVKASENKSVSGGFISLQSLEKFKRKNSKQTEV